MECKSLCVSCFIEIIFRGVYSLGLVSGNSVTEIKGEMREKLFLMA
jgi:hypothetical protein